MNEQESLEYFSNQREVVAKLGALVTDIESTLAKIETSASDSVDLDVVRKLLPTLNSFHDSFNGAKFYSTNNLETYSREVRRQVVRLSNRCQEQTLPSKAKPKGAFLTESKENVKVLGEVMIATAQLVPTPIDANLAAGTAFSAYLVLSELISKSVVRLMIIDPYLDDSIFYRYLDRIGNSVDVGLTTSTKILKGARLTKFEAIETVFKSQHSEYSRQFVEDLHDRYILSETCGYQLGGSLKDAGRKSDFSIIELSEERREQLISKYAQESDA